MLRHAAFAVIAVLTAAPNLAAMPIYNNTDDRQFTESVKDTKLLRLAGASVALVEAKNISPKGFMSGEPLTICEGEDYIDEVKISFCSGVLIAPDTVATAAHCLAGKQLKDIRVVFGYTQREDYPNVKPEQLYEITAASSGLPDSLSKDIALIRLNRPASGCAPVKIADATPRAGSAVITAGHPLGMPQMLQSNGSITKVSSGKTFFMTDLDNNWGQSGSPVFDADGKLLGIVQGNLIPNKPGATSDFYFDEDARCYRHRRENIAPMQAAENELPAHDREDLKSIADKKNGKFSIMSGSAVTCIAPFLKQLEAQAQGAPLKPAAPTSSAKAAKLKLAF